MFDLNSIYNLQCPKFAGETPKIVPDRCPIPVTPGFPGDKIRPTIPLSACPSNPTPPPGFPGDRVLPGCCFAKLAG
ncbi:hypothetical protein [Bartonella taylorii]|uniref:Uncharacterized protein n=1 Tax=Bartonella taylorii TaxID=33046 RepID=A0A9Q9DMD9_BARTA|nr:hypothetical protein [Bartonella taylorii]USP03057.1 hypothetical protein LAJ60_00945 [Bartonella taylorii]